MNKKFVLLFIFLSVFSILFISCSSNISKQTTSEIIIFPSPPDTPRIQFLTKISSSIDITGERSGIMKYVAGEDKGDIIVKPYGIRIYKGKLYVCDTILGGLEIIDLEKKTFEYFQPKGFGTIKKPVNLEVDKKGNIYVVDSGRREIIVFDKNLKYKTSFGNKSELKPTDVFFYDNKLWVSNVLKNNIEVYNANNFEYLYSLPDYKVGEKGFLNQPTNIYIKDDTLYVSDFGSFDIKIFTTKGKYIRSVGSYGRGLGQFVRPKGIAVDNDYNLYVVDTGFENVQMFDPSGNLLMFFGGTYEGPGYMWLPAKIIIDYDNLKYFQKYVASQFNLKYLIFVTNQYGPDKISVYGYVDMKK